jgi:hypothetical protein
MDTTSPNVTNIGDVWLPLVLSLLLCHSSSPIITESLQCLSTFTLSWKADATTFVQVNERLGPEQNSWLRYIIAIMPVIISKRTCSYFSSGKSSISYNGPVASRLYEVTAHPQYPVLPTHAQIGWRRRLLDKTAFTFHVRHCVSNWYLIVCLHGLKLCLIVCGLLHSVRVRVGLVYVLVSEPLYVLTAGWTSPRSWHTRLLESRLEARASDKIWQFLRYEQCFYLCTLQVSHVTWVVNR